MKHGKERAEPACCEQEAADWLARRAAGLDPAQERAWELWLAAEPRRAAIYAELEETWRALDGVRSERPSGAPPDPDLLAPVRRRFVRPGLAVILAAAAVAMVAGISWRHDVPDTPRVGGRAVPAGFTEVAATAVGELRTIDLPDGSFVRLSPDSRIEVAYSGTERRVRLVGGEGHFTVAKDHRRPFHVEAGGVTVRAVGTAFNVRKRTEAVEVLVTEGQVRVAEATRDSPRAVFPPGSGRLAGPLLSAGQRLVIAPPARPAVAAAPARATSLAPSEIQRALAWQDRRIEAVAAPLAEIVADFNGFNRTKIVIPDPALAARRFGGSFRADEPETFVRLLETRFGLRVERRDREIVLRDRP